MAAPPTLLSDEAPARSRQRRIPLILAIAVLAMLVYLLMPTTMNEPARRTTAIFVVAAVLWATEALPLFATSFVVIGLQILFLADVGGLADVLPSLSLRGGTPPDGPSLVYTTFLTPFSSDIIILFLGGFLLSAAVAKHGLDRVLASRLLSPLTDQPGRMVMAVMGLSALFSVFMSNTATAAMMLAVIWPIIRPLPTGSHLARGLILAVPLGANIGGISTPISTPPNALAMANLRAAGYDIGFLQWMLFAVPLVLVLLLGASLLLARLLPVEKDLQLETIEAPKSLGRAGRLTGVILVVTIALWVTAGWHGMTEAVVALLAAAALSALRLLDRSDVDQIDWNILILMWGGLSLGNAMQHTQLVDYVVALSPAQASEWVLAAFVVVLSLGLGTFMSNTATASLIVPMAMALSSQFGAQLAVLTALSCSLAMAMPISTPPNAIAFATGRIRSADMIRVGVMVSVGGGLILLLGYRVMFGWLLDF